MGASSGGRAKSSCESGFSFAALGGGVIEAYETVRLRRELSVGHSTCIDEPAAQNCVTTRAKWAWFLVGSTAALL